MQFKNLVCSACRKYGVPLQNGKCDTCYWMNKQPASFKPTLLPLMVLDLRSDEPFRTDIRRTTGRNKEWV